jgi:hypothetical protein
MAQVKVFHDRVGNTMKDYHINVFYSEEDEGYKVIYEAGGEKNG